MNKLKNRIFANFQAYRKLVVQVHTKKTKVSFNIVN